MSLETIIGSLKFELHHFDGTGDFNSWTKKMHTLSVQHKLQKVILDPSTLSSTDTNVQIVELQETVLSLIILYLADNVIRQIND